MLRSDTVERIRQGAGTRYFGVYLQHHLDRFPPIDHESYLALLANKPVTVKIKRRKAKMIISAGAANRVKRAPKPLPESLRSFQEAYNSTEG
jgi:hypothetical protein